MSPRDTVPFALRDTLSTPNENDSRGEPANVVDGLFAIARSLDAIAVQLERISDRPPSATPEEEVEAKAEHGAEDGEEDRS